MCCFYTPARWVASCLQWAAGEKVCHLPRRPTLQKSYDAWKKGFSFQSSAEEWREGLKALKENQLERYTGALELLEVRYCG